MFTADTRLLQGYRDRERERDSSKCVRLFVSWCSLHTSRIQVLTANSGPAATLSCQAELHTAQGTRSGVYSSDFTAAAAAVGRISFDDSRRGRFAIGLCNSTATPKRSWSRRLKNACSFDKVTRRDCYRTFELPLNMTDSSRERRELRLERVRRVASGHV